MDERQQEIKVRARPTDAPGPPWACPPHVPRPLKSRIAPKVQQALGIWLVDSGCSDHITGSDLMARTSDCKTIYATANGAVTPTGIGTAETPVGRLPGVRCVSTSPNLLSLGTLIGGQGFQFHWTKGQGAKLTYPNGFEEYVPVHNRVP